MVNPVCKWETLKLTVVEAKKKWIKHDAIYVDEVFETLVDSCLKNFPVALEIHAIISQVLLFGSSTKMESAQYDQHTNLPFGKAQQPEYFSVPSI